MLLKHLRLAASLCAATIGLALIGCGGNGDSGFDTTGSTSGNGSRGTLAVRMADAHNPDVTAVNVTIDRVQANVDGSWVDLPVLTEEVNLYDLTENDILLATGEVPTGSYNQIRVFVTSATVTDSEGTHVATIPSGAQTGLKLNVNYDIRSNDITTLLLDFNVDKSIVKTGNGRYMLKPVIPVVVKVLSGTIMGRVHDAADNPVPATHVRAIYTAGSNYPIGTEVNTAFTGDLGKFKVWALLPGTYTLEFEHVDGEVVRTTTLEDVVVEANADTNVGIVVLE